MGNSYTELGQAIQRTGLNTSAMIGQMNREKQELQVSSLMIKQQEHYQDLIRGFENDPDNYQQIEQRFNEAALKINEEGAKGLTGPHAQQLYRQASQQMQAKFSSQAKDISANFDYKQNVTNMEILLNDQVKNIRFDQDGYAEDIGKIQTAINGSSLLLPAEKEKMIAQYSEAALNKAVMAGAHGVFDVAEGSYSDKAQAARDWISSTEGAQGLAGGSMTADQFEKMNEMINSWESDAWRRQDRADKEANTAYDDQARQMYFDALQSGSTAGFKGFLFDKQNNPPNDRLPMYWLGQLEGLEADLAMPGDSGTSGKYEHPGEFLTWMNDLAMMEDKDLSYKQRAFTEKYMELNLPADKMETLRNKMEETAAIYQDSNFKAGFDSFSSFMKEAREGKRWDGVSGDQMEALLQERFNILVEEAASGKYSPEQFFQASQNLQRELSKEATALELEDTTKNLSGVSVHSMNNVNDMIGYMKDLENGQILGGERYFKEDHHQFETVYDHMFSQIDPQKNANVHFDYFEGHGAQVQSFEKRTGLYDHEGKPSYIVTLNNGSQYHAQIRSDGTLAYWVQEGSNPGEGYWQDMGFGEKGVTDPVEQTGVVSPQDIAPPAAGTPQEDITTAPLKAAGDRSVGEAEFNPYNAGVQLEENEEGKDRNIFRRIGNFFGGKD